jgi:hypothetical protein
MAHKSRGIQAEGACGQSVEVTPIARPSKGNPGQDTLDWNLFDGLESAGESFLVTAPHGRESHTAISDDDSGNAVPTTGTRKGVPEQLSIEVSMRIDEAGSHDPTLGVDRTPSGTLGTQIAHLDDAIALDRNVGHPRRPAGSIDNGSASDQEIVHRISILPAATCILTRPRRHVRKAC